MRTLQLLSKPLPPGATGSLPASAAGVLTGGFCGTAALAVALLLAVVPCALAAEGAGDSSAAAQARADFIAPFIDPLTVLVVRIDTTKIDPDLVIKQIEDWQKIAIKDPKELRESVADMKKELQLPRQLLRDFRQAGGRDFYVVCSLADPQFNSLFFAVVPIEPGANVEALTAVTKQLYRPDKSGTSQRSATAPKDFATAAQIHGAIVADTDGMTIKRLQVLEPTPQPQIQAAFAATAGAGVQFLAMASPDVRTVLGAMLPLSPENQQQEQLREPIQSLVYGLQWATAGMDLPPQTRLRLVAQAGDPATARQVLAAIRKLCDLGIANLQDESRRQTLRVLFQALLPAEPQGDKLVQVIDNDQVSKILSQVAPPLALARAQARKTFSMNNLGQWVRAMHVHYGEYNAWPDDFHRMMRFAMRISIQPGDWSPDICRNPQRPSMVPAYIYIRPSLPPQKIANPGAVVAVYERYDDWGDGINVAFLDGHVVFVKDQAEFEKMLAATKAQDPGGTVVAPALVKTDAQKPQADTQKSDATADRPDTGAGKPDADAQQAKSQ